MATASPGISVIGPCQTSGNELVKDIPDAITQMRGHGFLGLSAAFIINSQPRSNF